MKAPIVGLAIAALVAALDQASKWLITGPLALGTLGSPTVDVLPIFRLRFVANDGVSGGFLRAAGDSGRWLLVAMTAAIALGVMAWLWRERRPLDRIGLGMILGGAIGNIADRVRLGYVVDWADLHFGEWSPFLVFNLGDAAITLGVVILLARAFLLREKPVAREKVETGNG